MIRVVLDTNVVVSSLLSTGSPKAIFNLATNQRFGLYVSEPILAEYVRVLSYARLHIEPKHAKRAMAEIREKAHLIFPQVHLEEASHDEDNRFLECAQAGKANYLVTGNERHFPKVWKYTKIVQPREFLNLWQLQKPLADKP